MAYSTFYILLGLVYWNFLADFWHLYAGLSFSCYIFVWPSTMEIKLPRWSKIHLEILMTK